MVIFTDSSSDLTKEYMHNNDINCIDLTFTLDAKSYPNLEAAGMTLPMFYTFLREGGKASTSLLTVEDFINAFEPVISSGRDLVYIGLSAGLSGSYESSKMAAAELKKKYPSNTAYTCDTRMASMGVALIVRHAMRFRAEGKSCEEFFHWHKANRSNFNALFTVDDLNFLRRGGRLKSSSAVLGTLLKIKPVLNTDDEGHLVVREKARGRKASLTTLIERMCELTDDYDQPMCLSHGDCADEAQSVIDQLHAIGVKDVLTGYIGPVIGAHSGPGTVAFFFMGRGSVYPKH